MAGPTGPQLLRDGSGDYLVLVGRRLVTAGPADRPFSSCVGAAEKLGLSRSLHEAEASSFQEYFDESRAAHSLAELKFGREGLDALLDRAGLFAPRMVEKLIVPERHAAEAPHPREPIHPARGAGLPPRSSIYRSALSYGDSWVLELGSGANARRLASHDRGLHWQAAPGRADSGPSGPCAATPDGKGFSLIVSEADETVVVSRGASGSSHMTKLAARDEQVAAADCDETGLLALLVDRSKLPRLRTCSLEGACVDVPLPSLGTRALGLDVDVAWLGGDLVLAARSGRLTRVTTSRDRGQSWTPWVLAFDGREWLPVDSGAAPDRLLHVGDDLLLYGRAGKSESYLALISRDHGASFSPDFTMAPEGDRLVHR